MKPETLQKFIKQDYNVLFNGRHGVGKTTMVKEAFDKAGLKWKYFSASTMDPWVDFVGVPRERTDEHGEPYLDLVRPRDFRDDTVEAIFFDEYNRSHKKVRNAVMELIQFKSINGRKFENLRFIWAAINPSDDADHHYDVEEIDPAQEDRFEIHIDLPYKPSKKYFKEKYGAEMAGAACEWWDELGKEAKNEVSPRRLDYALAAHKNGTDLSYILPKKSNFAVLKKRLSTGSVATTLEKMFVDRDTAKAEAFLALENNFSAGITHICKDAIHAAFFLPLLTPEKLSLLLTSKDVVATLVQGTMVEQYHKVARFQRVIDEIVAAGRNVNMTRKLANVALTKSITIKGLSDGVGATPTQAQPTITQPVVHKGAGVFSQASTNTYYANALGQAQGELLSKNSSGRKKAYEVLEGIIPATMSFKEGVDTMRILCEVLNHSQVNTIKRKMVNAAGMLNTAYANIIRVNPNYTIADIRREVRDAGGSTHWASLNSKLSGQLAFTF